MFYQSLPHPGLGGKNNDKFGCGLKIKMYNIDLKISTNLFRYSLWYVFKVVVVSDDHDI